MPKKPLTPEEREERRKNWLAPTGTQQERRFLKKLLVQPGLSNKDRMFLDEWIAKPDGFEKRNMLFWSAAKKSVLGPVVYDMAMERHKKLRPDEWLVACLIAEGIDQKEIALMIGKSLRTVESVIAAIKEIIVQDLQCEIEAVNLAQISRWFLGL